MTARPSYDYRGLSRLVRGKVDALGIGYRAAAAAIGVTASDLSRISAGQSVAFEKVVAICDWCDVPERLFYSAPSTKSDCCSAAHVKQPAEGQASDRRPAVVRRPAGGPVSEANGAAREAFP